MKCPVCDIEMKLVTEHKMLQHKRVQLEFDVECYKCEKCLLRASTIEQTSNAQWAILDAYHNALDEMRLHANVSAL